MVYFSDVIEQFLNTENTYCKVDATQDFGMFWKYKLYISQYNPVDKIALFK